MTEAEYLEYDLAHEGKHELYNGEIVAMAGASEAHALVTMNPKLVVEVLSPSTAGHDRGPKAAHSRRIPTLGAYMIVDIESDAASPPTPASAPHTDAPPPPPPIRRAPPGARAG